MVGILDFTFSENETEKEVRHEVQLKDQKCRVFQKLFEAAEIAKFTPDEKNKYEESLKYYRDLKNVVDTSFDEGKAEGKEERNIEIARQMKSEGEPIEKIVRFTGLTKADIENLL